MDDRITFLNGDCFELMRNIPDGSVDMVLTDPPYGTTAVKWDSVPDLGLLWEELNRVAKRNAAVCIFSKQPFTTDLINSNRKAFRYEWVWYKTMPVGFIHASTQPLGIHENICVFCRARPVYNPQKTAPTHEPRMRFREGGCPSIITFASGMIHWTTEAGTLLTLLNFLTRTIGRGTSTRHRSPQTCWRT